MRRQHAMVAAMFLLLGTACAKEKSEIREDAPGVAAKATAPSAEAAAAKASDEADEAKEAGEAGEAEDAPAGTVAKLTMEDPALAARAKVTDEAARAAALERVPGGRITGAELEEEDGLLIYSYDIKVEGKEGVEEVHVDAMTGKVVKTEHEGEEGGL